VSKFAVVEDFTQHDYQRLTTGLPHQRPEAPVYEEEVPLADDVLHVDASPFERAILHLDLDSFFISVERLKDSSLVGRPLIVGGRAGRGVVASCSYEARAFGVRSAMPMRMALKLCPEALVIRGDMESYSNYSRLVTDVIAVDAPLYEKSSIDEFYCDLTGMDKYVGCWKWSVELRERVMKETGLPISFGLSVNKLVSKVGTSEAKPNGTLMIRNGLERDFLSPLSAAKLPGLGKKTYHKLSFMGVRTVKLLREIPVTLLEREFGKHGRAMARKANAIDDSPVVPHSERKSLSKERTFQQDTTDIHYLRDVLTDMVTRLSFDLRQSGQLASCITVKIRYTDFQTFTKQRRIAYTANDKHFMRHANEMFDRLHERRQMVRLVGVRFSGLVRGHYQVDLFEDTQRDINLMGAMDDIRARFGESAIRRARCMA
jgi:DNA polymerase-4